MADVAPFPTAKPRVCYLHSDADTTGTDSLCEAIKSKLQRANEDPRRARRDETIELWRAPTTVESLTAALSPQPARVVVISSCSSEGTCVCPNENVLADAARAALKSSLSTPSLVVLLCHSPTLAATLADAGVLCVTFTGRSSWSHARHTLGAGSDPGTLLAATAVPYLEWLLDNMVNKQMAPVPAHEAAVHALLAADTGSPEGHGGAHLELVPPSYPGAKAGACDPAVVVIISILLAFAFFFFSGSTTVSLDTAAPAGPDETTFFVLCALSLTAVTAAGSTAVRARFRGDKGRAAT